MKTFYFTPLLVILFTDFVSSDIVTQQPIVFLNTSISATIAEHGVEGLELFKDTEKTGLIIRKLLDYMFNKFLY